MSVRRHQKGRSRRRVRLVLVSGVAGADIRGFLVVTGVLMFLPVAWVVLHIG